MSWNDVWEALNGRSRDKEVKDTATPFDPVLDGPSPPNIDRGYYYYYTLRANPNLTFSLSMHHGFPDNIKNSGAGNYSTRIIRQMHSFNTTIPTLRQVNYWIEQMEDYEEMNKILDEQREELRKLGY